MKSGGSPIRLWTGYAGDGLPSGSPGLRPGSGLSTCCTSAFAPAPPCGLLNGGRSLPSINRRISFASIVPLQQSRRHTVHQVLMRVQDVVSRPIGLVRQVADFGVDLPRRFLGEVAVLRDLAAQEDLLFLFAEGQRTKAAHAV